MKTVIRVQMFALFMAAMVVSGAVAAGTNVNFN